jgi:hypothetical protein
LNLDESIKRTHDHLLGVALQFLDQQSDNLSASELSGLTCSLERGIQWFANRLRSTHINQIPGNSRCFWSMIDAINFWVDSFDPRWRYSNEDGRKRYLEWSNSCADEAIA